MGNFETEGTAAMKTAAASTAESLTASVATTGTATTGQAGPTAPMRPAPPTTPADSTTANIEARLARLERSARRWRLIGAAAVVVMVGMGAAEANKVPEEIRAKCFVVEGYDGEMRGTFGFTSENDRTGTMILVGADGKQMVGIAPGLPRIKFVKADGTTTFVE
jgi:hypothetical protein